MLFIRLCIIVLLAGFSLHSLHAIARLALMQLNHPILFQDSWIFTHRPALLEWPNLFKWFVAPYNNHRVALPKLVTVIETEVFKIPPATTSIVQSLLLVLLSSGIIALAASRIANRSTALVAWLTANAILLNRWQAENFSGEFQTPWFFINMLTLLSMLLLLKMAERKNGDCTWVEVIFFLLLPWLAIYSIGLGIALAGALVLTSLFVSRKLALLIAASTGLALIIYYFVLPYSSTGPLSFNLQFLMILLSGSSWRGMAILTLGLLVLLVLQTLKMLKENSSFFQQQRGVLAALLLPAVYAVFFALITTLARSHQGSGFAIASRYVTPMIMLPISCILLLAWMNLVNRSLPLKCTLTSLMPAILFFIAIILPLSYELGANDLRSSKSWNDTFTHRELLEQGFRCTAIQSNQLLSALQAAYHLSTIQSRKPRSVFQNKRLLDDQGLTSSCKTLDPGAGEGIKYMVGMKALKPLGWHQRLLADPSS